MNKFLVLSLALVFLAGAFAADGEMMNSASSLVNTMDGEVMSNITDSNGTVTTNVTVMNGSATTTATTSANVALNTSTIMGDITGLGNEIANETSASLGSLAFNGSMLAGSADNASNWINTVVGATIGNFNVSNPTWNATFMGLDSNITNLVDNLTLNNFANLSSNLTGDLSMALNMTSGFFSNEGETLETLLSNSTGVLSQVASELNTTQAEAAAGFVAYEAGSFLGVLAGNIANDVNTGDFSQLSSQVSSFETGVAQAADVFYNGTGLNSSVNDLMMALNTSDIENTVSNDIMNISNYASNVSSYAMNLTNVSVAAIPAALLSNVEKVYNVSSCFNSTCQNQSMACMNDATCNGLMMSFQSCLNSCGLPANFTNVVANDSSSLGSVNSVSNIAGTVVSQTSGFLSAVSSAAVDEAANLLGASSSTTNLSTSSVSCFESCFNPSSYDNNALFVAYLSCGVANCA